MEVRDEGVVLRNEGEGSNVVGVWGVVDGKRERMGRDLNFDFGWLNIL